MSENAAPRFHVVSRGEMGSLLQEIISMLRKQAADIDDTASRCTDPEIVSELKIISSQLQEEANRLEES